MSKINNILYNGAKMSNISTTNMNLTSSKNVISTTNMNLTSSKHRYNVLGDSIDIDGHTNIDIAIIIANINLNGEKFYRELKKQGVSLPSILEEFLENKFLIINRDEKINTLIN
jgi:hypothetical protein